MLALILLHSRGGFQLTIVPVALIWLNSCGGFNTVEKNCGGQYSTQLHLGDFGATTKVLVSSVLYLIFFV
jgi:hypothetical protein